LEKTAKAGKEACDTRRDQVCFQKKPYGDWKQVEKGRDIRKQKATCRSDYVRKKSAF